MYCTKCGNEINQNDKFCTKCGKAIQNVAQEQIKNAESPKNKNVQTKGSKTRPFLFFCGGIIALFILIIIGVGIYQAVSKKNYEILEFISMAALVIAIICSLFHLAKSITNKKIIKAIIYGVLIVVFSIICWDIYIHLKNQKITLYNNIQDAFTNTLSAQYLGDDIIAGKSNSNFSDVSTQTAASVDALSKIKPDFSLQDYYNSIYGWAQNLNSAAANKDSWKKRPDAPSSFSSPITGSEAKILFQGSLNRIVTTKDYGDWAIKKGDKDSMRYIAAELQAEYLSLGNNSISYLPNKNKFASLVIGSAEASTKTGALKISAGRCRGFKSCKKDTQKKLPPTFQSGHKYSVGDPGAAQEWTNAWNDLLNTIKIDNGYNISGAGASIGPSDNLQKSPMQQAFEDECTTKGGSVGGGGVYERLPTSLPPGTVSCHFKNKNNLSCWNLLTPSGQTFMGGGNTCPEQNLLPKTASTNNGGGGNNNNATFDGTYHVNFGATSCNVGTSLGYGSAISAAGVSNVITVTNNKIKNPDNTTSTIDSSGNATWVYNLSYGGTSSFKLTQTFHFSNNNVTGQVSLNGNVSSSAGTGTVTCSETFSGSK